MLEWVWRRGNPPTLLVGMEIGTTSMENSMEVPQETKTKATIQFIVSTHGHIPEENLGSKGYTHHNVHRNAVYNSQDTEAI